MVHEQGGIFYEDKAFDNVKSYDYDNPTNYQGGESTFEGWYLSADFSGDPVDPKNFTMPGNDVYLYAKWTPAQYTVTFDSRGGSKVPSQRVEKGETATKPADPTRDGFEFLGWYDENGVRWFFDQEITEDTTLYAAWKSVQSTGYTVEHIYRDGQGAEQTICTLSPTGSYRVGDTVTGRALNQSDEAYQEGLEQLGVSGLYLHLLHQQQRRQGDRRRRRPAVRRHRAEQRRFRQDQHRPAQGAHRRAAYA